MKTSKSEQEASKDPKLVHDLDSERVEKTPRRGVYLVPNLITTGALFSGDLRTLTSGELAQLDLDGLPSTEITEPAARVGETLVRVGLASSNGNAMQMIKSGAVSVNGAKISTPEATFADTPPLAGNCWLLRRGKRNWALVRIAGR